MGLIKRNRCRIRRCKTLSLFLLVIKIDLQDCIIDDCGAIASQYSNMKMRVVRRVKVLEKFSYIHKNQICIRFINFLNSEVRSGWKWERTKRISIHHMARMNQL